LGTVIAGGMAANTLVGGRLEILCDVADGGGGWGLEAVVDYVAPIVAAGAHTALYGLHVDRTRRTLCTNSVVLKLVAPAV